MFVGHPDELLLIAHRMGLVNMFPQVENFVAPREPPRLVAEVALSSSSKAVDSVAGPAGGPSSASSRYTSAARVWHGLAGRLLVLRDGHGFCCINTCGPLRPAIPAVGESLGCCDLCNSDNKNDSPRVWLDCHRCQFGACKQCLRDIIQYKERLEAMSEGSALST
jgi:hypothetical protein